MVTVLGVAAAFCYALGAALQHSVAADEPGGGAGFIAALLRRPAWMAGNVLNAFGWALQAAALGTGELVYVQPLLLLSVVLSLPLTAVIRRDAPGPREWVGCSMLLAGVVAFLIGTRPAPSGVPVAPDAWLWAIGATVLASSLCVGLGRRRARATMYAIAAGLLFGLAAALTKATVETGWQFLAQWPLYGLLPVTGAAFYLMQRAFQSGPLAASFPVIIALDPLVSVLLGLLLFGERVAGDAGSVALAAGGSVVALVGIAVLARSRFVGPDER